MSDSREISQRFEFHPADTREKQEAHHNIRVLFGELAAVVDSTIPDSREKSLALTELQTAMMWCNAAIAYR